MLSFLAGCVFKALTGGDLREDLSCMLNALPEALGVPRLCKATASDIRSPCFPCNGQKVSILQKRRVHVGGHNHQFSATGVSFVHRLAGTLARRWSKPNFH